MVSLPGRATGLLGQETNPVKGEAKMNRWLVIPLSLVMFNLGCTEEKKEEKAPVVVMETSLGTIKIQLDAEKAPITVKNFLQYVDDKFYDGLVFHRVIPDFMIQGGGFERLMDVKDVKEFQAKQKKTREAIKNESGNGLSNTRGTIAMARTRDLDSATAQFYINVADNSGKLDKPKYCVFGKVIEGMEVVDKIRDVKTRTILEDVVENVPVEDVIIKSVRREKK
jgi:cyclophilin family peptidyl-prolyl cis-trans isomerase